MVALRASRPMVVSDAQVRGKVEGERVNVVSKIREAGR